MRQGRKLPRPLADRLALPHVESAQIAGQEALLDVAAATPEETLDRIVAWLAQSGGPPAPIALPESPATAVHRTGAQPAVRERPLEMGPLRLFGMLSEAADGVEPSAPTVVFLNTGRIGHAGPARLWVDLSRSWAAEGWRCLRVDLNGLGDSPTRPGRTAQIEFPADALLDLDDMRRAISEEADTEVVFVGLCSGGYHAIEAALAEPVASVCVVNPALTYFRGGDPPPGRFEPDQDPGFADREAWGGTRPWLRRLMTRISSLGGATRGIPGRWWIHKRLFVTASPARTFRRLTESGVDVLIVTGDVEERVLYRGERRRFRALVRDGRLSRETVHHLEHTLLERTGRARVSALLHDHLARFVAVGARSTRHGGEE